MPGYKGTVTHPAATITLTGGNLVLPTGAGGSYSASNQSSVFTLAATSGTIQVTTNGFSLGALQITGAGGTVQLLDNLKVDKNISSSITLSAGTLDGQTFTVTTYGIGSTGSTAREIKGSGAWSILSGGISTIFNFANTNLTTTNWSSVITISGDHTTLQTIALGGFSLPDFVIGPNTQGAPVVISGANTFKSLTVNGPQNINLPASTQTVTNGVTINDATSDGTKWVRFQQITPISIAQTTFSSANPSNIYRGALRQLTFSGGGAANAYNSADLGSNIGITINAPPVGVSRASMPMRHLHG